MPVVHIDGDKPSFQAYRIIQRIRIIPFKNEILIVIAQGFIQPASLGKEVKHFVHFGPCTAYTGQGIFGQFFDITVQYQLPAVFVIIFRQDTSDHFPVGMKIIPFARAHV